MLRAKFIPSKPALLLEGERRSLVVSDIHIGFESMMATNKIHVNSTTDETITEMTDIISAQKPDLVVLLGDIKSSVTHITKFEWREVPKFLSAISDLCDVVIVPGNHDAGIDKLVPRGVTMISTNGMILEDVLLVHGHTMPHENLGYIDKIIMGHLHPVFFKEDSIMNGQRVWVSFQTTKSDIFSSRRGHIEITIVPSFNRYFYAAHKAKRRRSISPIINRVSNISKGRIMTLDGVIIGDESSIHQII